jgi:hypothetical protein
LEAENAAFPQGYIGPTARSKTSGIHSARKYPDDFDRERGRME